MFGRIHVIFPGLLQVNPLHFGSCLFLGRVFTGSHGYRLPSCITSSCATASSSARAWRVLYRSSL